jgi:prolyl 4-hydroxylase
VVSAIRDSQWASPNSSEPVVRTIERRVKSFQGFDNVGLVEPLKVLKYELGGHYNHHHDSFPEEVARRSMEGNRLSTFFVYLEANCTGGGTNFPRLKIPKDEKWCEFIDCDAPYDAGVTFRPVSGNAIYWLNLEANGRTPHGDLLHSGLPVTSGQKVGLNIWTWTPVDTD